MKPVEITFIIDEQTGELSADVSGAEGPACLDELLGELEEMLGGASTTRLKPEYHRRVVVNRQAAGQGGRRR